MSLSKTLYPLLSTSSTQEDWSQHDCKIDDWNIKHKKKKKSAFKGFKYVIWNIEMKVHFLLVHVYMLDVLKLSIFAILIFSFMILILIVYIQYYLSTLVYGGWDIGNIGLNFCHKYVRFHFWITIVPPFGAGHIPLRLQSTKINYGR